MDAYAVGWVDAGRCAQEMRAGGDEPPRHDSVGEHLAGSVDVRQEGFQRPDPLGDAELDVTPLGRRDDPRDDVERKGPLDAFQRERDALVEECSRQHLGPNAQLSAGQWLEGGVQGLIALPSQAELAEHLIPAGAEAVLLE